MLTFDPDDANHPRKLLSMVLMMAARDGASAVRCEPHRRAVGLWYFVQGVWYELVPAPQHIWPEMKKVIRESATLHSLFLEHGSWQIPHLDGPAPPPPPPSRWWQPRVKPAWWGGVLELRFGDETVRWSVVLDERHGREQLMLTGVKPAVTKGDADTLLQRMFGRHHQQPESTG